MAQGPHSSRRFIPCSTHIPIQQAEIFGYSSNSKEAEYYIITALEQNLNAIKCLAIAAFTIIIESIHNYALQNVTVLSSTESLPHF
jgi:hypothetical protein